MNKNKNCTLEKRCRKAIEKDDSSEYTELYKEIIDEQIKISYEIESLYEKLCKDGYPQGIILKTFSTLPCIIYLNETNTSKEELKELFNNLVDEIDSNLKLLNKIKKD